MLTVGSLFSGIGGFDLGLERAGMRTVWFCEQDDFCRRVLARHWPGVPCHPDVRALVADAGRGSVQPDGVVGGLAGAESRDSEALRPRELPAPAGGGSEGRGMVPVRVPPVDVLAGGFPCQDLSYAGRGAGLAGERSGLWREFARLIGELRPRYVLVENVPALTSRGLDVVLADLAACRFDAEWDHLPASAFGAPHRRDRIWLVAYPSEPGLEGPGLPGRSANGRADLADSARHGAEEQAPAGTVGERARSSGERSGAPVMAHAEGERCEPRSRPGNAMGAGQLTAVEPQGRVALPAGRGWATDHWLTEPDVGRVAHGIPARVDRLRSLGNALVPQIAEWIGRRIIEWESSMSA